MFSISVAMTKLLGFSLAAQLRSLFFNKVAGLHLGKFVVDRNKNTERSFLLTSITQDALNTGKCTWLHAVFNGPMLVYFANDFRS